VKAAELKLHLLVDGLSIDFDAINNDSFKSDKYLHNDRHFAPKSHKRHVPQELILCGGDGYELCVGVLSRPESPLHLKRDSNGLFIESFAERLDISVRFVAEPLFWSMTTNDGIPNFRILSVPGINELNLWPWHDCSLHYAGKGCTFCTTTSTANHFGTGSRSNLLTAFAIERSSDPQEYMWSSYPLLRERAIKAVSDALNHDYSSADYWVTIISGNLDQSLVQLQYEAMAMLFKDLISKVPGLRKDRMVANIMPPESGQAISLLKNAGVTHFMSNLEIWDSELFRAICPGKADYGRDKFLEMLQHAVTVFGEGNVWCNFVSGLEPLELQLDGYEYLAARGIVSGANVFHRDPRVTADFADDVSFVNLRDYYRCAANILRNHNLEPFYCMSSRRSSLIWEAYLGLL